MFDRSPQTIFVTFVQYSTTELGEKVSKWINAVENIYQKIKYNFHVWNNVLQNLNIFQGNTSFLRDSSEFWMGWLEKSQLGPVAEFLDNLTRG